MSSINSHYYLVGHATNGENPEVVYMKPTAENIANFIMKHNAAAACTARCVRCV